MDEYLREARERLARKVGPPDERGCLNWIGTTANEGYGRIYFRRRIHRAHRVAWILRHGQIPEGLHVLHRCDNPRCVNPDHLFLGSDADNAADRDAKNRGGPGFNPPGERSRTAKLTREQVDFIRQSTEKQAALARKFGVSHTAIRLIRQGLRWRAEK